MKHLITYSNGLTEIVNGSRMKAHEVATKRGQALSWLVREIV